jgi:hypothetical protein
LLDRGADVNAKDDEGATALMGFISPDFDISTGLPKPLTTDEEIDEMTIHTLLLDKGADIKAKDNKYGETALTHMAESGFTNMVTLLLDRGADITAKNYNGETALSRAADTGETNAVKLLLARGADINAVDTNGETALGKAKRQGNVAIVQLLQKAGATALSASDSFFNVAVASGTNTDSSGYVTNAALLTPFTLTNSAGDVITNAVLVKLMPNKFIYKTPTGVMGTRRLDSLSTELQNRFGYDAASAAAQDSIEAEAKMRAMQWQQSQRNLAQQQAELKAQSQSAVSDISRSIRAKAEKEWPGDYEMQRYEINKQTDAYNWLVIASSATGVPQQVFDQIKIKAASEWADDYEMQKYEITKQVKAYVELH